MICMYIYSQVNMYIYIYIYTCVLPSRGLRQDLPYHYIHVYHFHMSTYVMIWICRMPHTCCPWSRSRRPRIALLSSLFRLFWHRTSKINTYMYIYIYSVSYGDLYIYIYGSFSLVALDAHMNGCALWSQSLVCLMWGSECVSCADFSLQCADFFVCMYVQF